MSIKSVYLDNVLRETWNNDTRIVTFFTALGVQQSQRPYTNAENLQVDRDVAAEVARQQSLEETEAQLALVRANMTLAPPPTTGGAWVQPTGVHNAYALGSKVSHAGKDWESLTPFNVWAPGVSGWREVFDGGYPG